MRELVPVLGEEGLVCVKLVSAQGEEGEERVKDVPALAACAW